MTRESTHELAAGVRARIEIYASVGCLMANPQRFCAKSFGAMIALVGVFVGLLVSQELVL